MSETKKINPDQAPLIKTYTELPIEVSRERVQEVSNHFKQILDDYGGYVESRKLTGRIKFEVSKQPGRQAEFTAGDTKLIVSKFDNPDFAPETVATIFERNKERKWAWDERDTFTYNRNNKRQLDYRQGNIRSYIASEWPLENPGAEGIEDMLGSFLQEADQIIEKSRRPKAITRALGRAVTSIFRH